jgi:hypothetical protein
MRSGTGERPRREFTGCWRERKRFAWDRPEDEPAPGFATQPRWCCRNDATSHRMGRARGLPPQPPPVRRRPAGGRGRMIVPGHTKADGLLSDVPSGLQHASLDYSNILCNNCCAMNVCVQEERVGRFPAGADQLFEKRRRSGALSRGAGRSRLRGGFPAEFTELCRMGGGKLQAPNPQAPEKRFRKRDRQKPRAKRPVGWLLSAFAGRAAKSFFSERGGRNWSGLAALGGCFPCFLGVETERKSALDRFSPV